MFVFVALASTSGLCGVRQQRVHRGAARDAAVGLVVARLEAPLARQAQHRVGRLDRVAGRQLGAERELVVRLRDLLIGRRCWEPLRRPSASGGANVARRALPSERAGATVNLLRDQRCLEVEDRVVVDLAQPELDA